VKLLIDEEKTVLTMPDKDSGYTPLHLALKCRATAEVVKLVIDEVKTVLTMPDKNGDTPLHWALGYGATAEVVKLLIDEEQTVLTMPNKNGKTPFEASTPESLTTIKAILKDMDDRRRQSVELRIEGMTDYEITPATFLGGFVLNILYTDKVVLSDYPSPIFAYYNLFALLLGLGMNMYVLLIDLVCAYHTKRLLVYSNDIIADNFLRESAGVRGYSIRILYYSLPVLLSALIGRMFGLMPIYMAVPAAVIVLMIIIVLLVKLHQVSNSLKRLVYNELHV
jgi:hypothetical protein